MDEFHLTLMTLDHKRHVGICAYFTGVPATATQTGDQGGTTVASTVQAALILGIVASIVAIILLGIAIWRCCKPMMNNFKGSFAYLLL